MKKTTFITVRIEATTDISSFEVNEAYVEFRNVIKKMGYPRHCVVSNKDTRGYRKVGHAYGMPENHPQLMVKFVHHA